MTRKPLHIAVIISALLHLVMFTAWWTDQDKIVVASLTQGTPLTVSINPAKPEQTKQTVANSEQPSQQAKTMARTEKRLGKKSQAPTTTDRAKIIEPETKPQQADKNQERDYALLNNNMVDYLSSEFKIRFKYPILARKRGWQGEVVLALDINPRGKISQVVIQRSSGYKILDRNAVKTFEGIAELSPELSTTLAKEHHLFIPVVYKLTGS